MKFFGANFSALTLLTPSVSSSSAHYLYYDIAVPPTVIACTWKLMCINESGKYASPNTSIHDNIYYMPVVLPRTNDYLQEKSRKF